MHHSFHSADAPAEVIEFHARMIREQRHCTLVSGTRLLIMSAREPDAKRIIVMPRMPDRNAIGLPRFKRPTVAARVGTCGT